MKIAFTRSAFARRRRSNLDATIVRTQARDVLVGLFWKAPIARSAVDEALAFVGNDVALDVLIREALRRCPRPH